MYSVNRYLYRQTYFFKSYQIVNVAVIDTIYLYLDLRLIFLVRKITTLILFSLATV